MPVGLSARGRRWPRLAARLRRSAEQLLVALRLSHAELSVLLVSDRTMRQLNRRWRGVDRPTDVLAFAQREGAGGAPPGLLGDVVISVETARRQAARRGASVAAEAERLLVHGLLHLLGYDHERSAAEAARMRRRERALARRLQPAIRRRSRSITRTGD
ncbi:MAG TPA: rRNA maturation RNase YbeY [Alphaproteobacteria bacterium]|nr:rRNA maturation RNase YbeY [Alphaproteobacteria bacterium]